MEPTVPRYLLAPGYDISRVLKGGWQLAGGHGRIDREAAIGDMLAYVEAGITTFDCADIYTGVEELIGEFLRRNRDAFRHGTLAPVQIHTKCVPDRNILATLRKEDVRSLIDRSLRRLGVERLDLVQFHWWDYEVPGYVEAALQLQVLQAEGKIRHIGVTNFDVLHLREILDAGVPVISNQVQYSVLDHRPERGMVALCAQQGMSLLCYGTVAGGFLSDRYLGVAEPVPPLDNRSLTKYKLIIDDFGGWDLFQALLATMRGIADKHGVSVTAVATRYVLQKPRVGAAIIGVRHMGHLPDTLRLWTFELTGEDLAAITRIAEETPGPEGDIYGVERVKGGKHAVIMHYDLNTQAKA